VWEGIGSIVAATLVFGPLAVYFVLMDFWLWFTPGSGNCNFAVDLVWSIFITFLSRLPAAPAPCVDLYFFRHQHRHHDLQSRPLFRLRSRVPAGEDTRWPPKHSQHFAILALCLYVAFLNGGCLFLFACAWWLLYLSGGMEKLALATWST